MWILLLILSPLLFVLIPELWYFRTKKIINRIKGPSTLPLLGNGHQIGKTPSELLQNLLSWWIEYGKTNYRIWVGYIPNVMVSAVKDVEFILSSNTMLEKSDLYDMFHPWLGTGLITSTGDKWSKHRKMITPTFHFKILQNYHEVMNTNSNKFIEKLRKISAGETIFDFQEEVHYLTLDVICESAMGVSINAMDNHESALVKAFQEIGEMINLRVFHPLKRKNYLYRFMPEYPEYLKILKTMQDFTYNVIQQRSETLKNEKENPAAPKDNTDEFSTRRKQAFLDTLLTATIDNKPLTLQAIYEEVSTFVFAGHDTTTSGISFAVYLLSRHKEIQQKVYDEQKLIMGDNMKRDATFQEIADMKYLDLVIKESQRLYPTVPMIGRHAEKDYNMNGTLIPKGTSLNVFIMGMGYNEEVFPDPYRCNPDRFDVKQQTERRNPFEYVPFSAGPRNCVGQKFAFLELKTVISKMVRNFEILPPLDELWSTDGYVQHYVGQAMQDQMKRKPNLSKYDPILSAKISIKSDNGIQLRLRERK